MGVAEEMGAALQTTASSVNIKERLDFSCAVFDARGGLVANAPHIPVHLGSMGESVRAIVDARGEAKDGRGIRPGDIYMLNTPHAGGTHLPDITVIAPVILDGESQARLLHRRARPSCRHRRHHAGLDAARQHGIDEEGVLIENFLLVENGRLRRSAKRARCSLPAPYPRATSTATSPTQGADRCMRARRRGTEASGRALRPRTASPPICAIVQDNAEEQIRRVIDRVEASSPARWTMARRARGGAPGPPKRHAVQIDFAGTSAQTGTISTPARDHARGRALCLPHSGRRRRFRSTKAA